MADDATFEYVRGRDRERVGWLRMTGDDLFVAHDLLWRQVGEPTGLAAAEQALDEVGLRYLADLWWLATDDEPLLVQICEVTESTVTVAPVSASEHIALAADLTRLIKLPNPTDRLRPAPR